MEGRIVVITGANGGLGTAVTHRFLNAGDTVVGASRHIKQNDFPGPNFVAVPTDFRDPTSVRQLADTAVQRFGGIHSLIHIIGGFSGGIALHETDERTWSQMQDLNLTAAFHVIRAVIPYMRKAGYGRFIAIGSKAAENPVANLGAYVVFKRALVTMVHTLALENAAHGITANIVLPGTMDTPTNRSAMPGVDPKSWLQPADVANTIFWLAGDEAAHVSGASIPIA